MPGYDDDLRLAHVLADAVERVTVARFRAEDLRVETKPDLTLVSDADRDAEELIRGQLKRTRPARRRHRRGVPHHRVQPAPVGRRPDRRHAQLRARRAGVGDAHLARRRRRPGDRPGRRARPRPALVGGPGVRRLGRAEPDLGQADPRLAGVAARGRLDLVLELDLVGGRRARGAGARPRPGLLARARLRRLLVLHAARRGRGRHRRRARAGAARHGGPGAHRHRGRRPVHLARRASTGRSAATRSRPTASCTTRC